MESATAVFAMATIVAIEHPEVIVKTLDVAEKVIVKTLDIAEKFIDTHLTNKSNYRENNDIDMGIGIRKGIAVTN